MSDTIRSAAAATSAKFVIERTYRASVDELWDGYSKFTRTE